MTKDTPPTQETDETMAQTLDYTYDVAPFEGDPDFDGSTLLVAIYDVETEEIVGLFTMSADFTVSDHGNVNVSPDVEARVAGVVARVAGELR